MNCFAAIERGFTDFDFTIGDEPYKLDWADRQLVLYDHLSALHGARLAGRLSEYLSARG